MAVDQPQNLLDLLSTNWLSANTGGKTPEFVKITDKRLTNRNINIDWVIAHRPRPQQEAAGIGTLAKHKHAFIDIDIRSTDKGGEDHWLDVIAEVDRIFDNNIIDPNADTSILNSDHDRQDLSDKRFNSWRYLITVKVSKYVILR